MYVALYDIIQTNRLVPDNTERIDNTERTTKSLIRLIYTGLFESSVGARPYIATRIIIKKKSLEIVRK